MRRQPTKYLVAPTNIIRRMATSIAPVDAGVRSIEESVVAIVRFATSARLQARIAAEAGEALDRSLYGVLGALEDEGPVPLTSLARRLGLDASTVSRQVSALERSGMVLRTKDPNDRRIALLTLTVPGRRALRRLRRARHQLFGDVLSQWDSDQRDVLAPLLARFAADLTAEGERW
jgi:DNA-binding MarR family transcriptional regulator